MVLTTQSVWKNGGMTDRPFRPNQSGIQAGWPMSQVPDLLLTGALPRSVKKLEPGSALPFSVMPHCFRLAWIAVNTEVLTESFAYRYVRVRLDSPACLRSALHLAVLAPPLACGYGVFVRAPTLPGGITLPSCLVTVGPP